MKNLHQGLKIHGTILYDSKIGEFITQENIKAIGVPAMKIAKEKGVGKAANTAMLGVLMAISTDFLRKSF